MSWVPLRRSPKERNLWTYIPSQSESRRAWVSWAPAVPECPLPWPGHRTPCPAPFAVQKLDRSRPFASGCPAELSPELALQLHMELQALNIFLNATFRAAWQNTCNVALPARPRSARGSAAPRPPGPAHLHHPEQAGGGRPGRGLRGPAAALPRGRRRPRRPVPVQQQRHGGGRQQPRRQPQHPAPRRHRARPGRALRRRAGTSASTSPAAGPPRARLRGPMAAGPGVGAPLVPEVLSGEAGGSRLSPPLPGP